jgi:hypothetical protein
VTLRNSILAGNTAPSAPDCSGTLTSAGYNLIGEPAGCDFVSSIGDQLTADAKLDALTGSPGYHPLLFGSPAIDAGNPAGCRDNLGNPLDTDQRGVPRARQCDIGAYEYDGPYFQLFLPVIARNWSPGVLRRQDSPGGVSCCPSTGGYGEGTLSTVPFWSL